MFDILYMLLMCIWMCLPATLRLAVVGVVVILGLDFGVAVVRVVVVGLDVRLDVGLAVVGELWEL